MVTVMSATGAILSLAMVMGAAAEKSGAPRLPDRRETFGAVLGPSALPVGALAAYAYAGLPEVGAGFRQGLTGFEWEARARFNYLTLSLAAEGVLKWPLLRTASFDLAPFAGAGLTASSGIRYFDPSTFPYVGARFLAGAAASYKASETIRLLAFLEVPYDSPFATGGGGKLVPLAGGGAEIFLSDEVSALVLGQAGLDWVKEPLGVPVARVGYAIRLGMGWRMF